MIHVVTADNQHLYARQLDEMFRMRHEFYVEQRGWTNLTSSDGRETDEFDNEHAVYLMNLDRFGHIQATFRLNPTNTPYLLADKLPHYLDETPPRSAMIWDLTRWMVAPNARRKAADSIADAQKFLICGVMEFAVSRGITHYTTLTDTVFVDRISKVWPVRPMGTAHHFDDGDGDAIAVMIEAGPHILAQSRDRTGVYSPVLFELNPTPPRDTEDKEMREKSMQDMTPVNRKDLESIQTAAEHMIEQLKTISEGDVDTSVDAIDAFTSYIRGITRNQELEDA